MVIRALGELARLKRNQWLDRPALEQVQLAKLKPLLKHAYDNVAYYRTLFDGVAVKPEDVQSLEDLQRIPITTRARLQSLTTDQVVSRGTDVGRCLERRTSGSTGKPLTVYISPKEKLGQTLVSLRILLENGLRLGDRLAHISTLRRFPPQNRWFQRLGILRRCNISVFDELEDQVRFIARTRPDVLYGYPSSLTLLAREVTGSQAIPFRPRLVFTTGELLRPHTRAFLESTFGVEVCDVYGTVEFGDMGWECEQREGYHINADCLIVEFVKNGRQALSGESGELVCTSLHSYVMPLIRYRVGDVCTPAAGRCGCDRGLPLMRVMEGRSDDFICLPDGGFVSPLALANVMKSVDGITDYRIVQQESGAVDVRIAGNPELPQEAASRVKTRLGPVLGGVEVVVKTAHEIRRDDTGKIRAVTSKVTTQPGHSRDWSSRCRDGVCMGG